MKGRKPHGRAMKQVLRIGTRRSKLSLWQANHVAELIREHHPAVRVEVHQYKTLSDLKPAAPLRSIGRRGIFTGALEAALQASEIDCAVHSLKDLPVESAAGLALAAVPKRGDHRDALLSRGGATLAQLPPGARIGTGSLRRRAQLLVMRPDLKMTHIRGNVPTRLEKLLAEDSRYDAIVLAVAGLKRLRLSDHISETFDEAQMLCAAGQGALAIQCRAEDMPLLFFRPLSDWQSFHATAGERAFLNALDAGCSLPVAAYARVEANRLVLQGRVIALDGSRQVDVHGETSALDGPAGMTMAEKLGAELAQKALEKGADQILQSINLGGDL